MIDYLTVKEVGKKWGVLDRMATIYCNNGKIGGTIKKGNLCLIPIGAENPLDGRMIKV